MGQAREHGRLAGEILDGFFLGDSVAQDHFLDCDGAIGEAGIVGQVDPAHAAHAENLAYSVSIVEEMALGKRLTRIHSASSIPGDDSADRASRRAASHAGQRSRDRIYRKFQKCLANNDLVTGLELDGSTGLQAGPAVHVGAVQAADVLNGYLSFRDSDQRV